ncbi:hypothetical protein QBC41DRAFT_3784 [Cercophora samala]|uniref:Uncharacterized protein n=1 Tax=Cercophora samala TaxID=330535 RepID=A0AA39ZNY6_9PEZI|nr:hypothetical protein QBC41DRAFT_3784 [Cercophora samala]
MGAHIQNQSMQHTFSFSFPVFLPSCSFHKTEFTSHVLPSSPRSLIKVFLGFKFPAAAKLGGVLPINPISIFSLLQAQTTARRSGFYAPKVVCTYQPTSLPSSRPSVLPSPCPYKIAAGWLCLTCNAHCAALHCTSLSFLPVRSFAMICPAPLHNPISYCGAFFLLVCGPVACVVAAAGSIERGIGSREVRRGRLGDDTVHCVWWWYE